ncbi:hypothetical protein ES704_02930 [subsurface metagenome]
MKFSETEILTHVSGFEWNEGNIIKNWERHKVTYFECEEIFFNEPIVVQHDKVHSAYENRYFALGKTDEGRLLFVVFTIRGDKIRVISARDMSKKERRCYQ